MHLHNCGSNQEHLERLLEYLTVLCIAAVGFGNISKDIGALMRLTGLPERLVSCFCIIVYIADVIMNCTCKYSVQYRAMYIVKCTRSIQLGLLGYIYEHYQDVSLEVSLEVL